LGGVDRPAGDAFRAAGGGYDENGISGKVGQPSTLPPPRLAI